MALKSLFFYSSFLFYSCLYALEDPSKFTLVDKNSYHTLSKEQSKLLKLRMKKGDLAIGSVYGDDKSIEWSNRFTMVELGGLDDKEITEQTFSQKKLLGITYKLGYDWMPAGYYYLNGQNSKIMSWLFENRYDTTLNPEGPFVHCKNNNYDWCQDFYYNLGSTEVIIRRVEDIKENIISKKFDGVFFDWASGRYLYDSEYKLLLENFKQKNSNEEYLEQVAEFYKQLRAKGIFVVTNQAFRADEYLLKYIQYDMTESYITTVRNTNYNIKTDQGLIKNMQISDYYPASKDDMNISDTLTLIDRLDSYRLKYTKDGFKNFIYLNYLSPEYERVVGHPDLYKVKKPRNGIFFGYAMAKLRDNFVYAQVPYDARLERDELYFYDLGEVLGKSYTCINIVNGYIRFYTKGFVLASSALQKDQYLHIESSLIPKGKKIYDLYNAVWINQNNKSATVKLHSIEDGFTGKPLPLGRVFLYED